MRASTDISKVRLLGWLLGLVALCCFDLALFRENRLLAGQGLTVWQLPVPSFGLMLTALWLALLPGCLASGRGPRILGLLSAVILLPGVLLAVGQSAGQILQDAPPGARVSLGAGFWVCCFSLLIIGSDLCRSLPRPWLWKQATLAAAGGLLAWILLAGAVDQLSLMIELSQRRERFVQEMANHLGITGLSVSASALVGLPLGFCLFRFPRLRQKVMPVLSSIQTIPSLALFGLLIAPLALLVSHMPFLERLGIHGIGWAPAVIALALYALLPIVHNTQAGFASVGPAAIEAGQGIGMNRFQLLLFVQLPLALPVIFNGLRIASVQNIGNTAVAALIGAGGFGAFIFQGMGQAAVDLILLGALPTIGIAVVADWIWQILIGCFQTGGRS